MDGNVSIREDIELALENDVDVVFSRKINFSKS